MCCADAAPVARCQSVGGSRSHKNMDETLAQKIPQFSFALAKIFFKSQNICMESKICAEKSSMAFGSGKTFAGKVTKLLAHKIPQCPLDSMALLSACSV